MSTLTRFSVSSLILGPLAMAIMACGGTVSAIPSSPGAGNGQSQSTPKTMQELIQAAQKEGEIDYTDTDGVSDASLLRAIESSMKDKYGLTIRITVSGGPSMAEMVTRTIQEHQANQMPSMDLFRVTVRQSFQLKGTGATEAVDWKAYDPTIQPEEITSDGAGLVSFADRVGIVYNTKLVSAGMVPRTLEDLCDPKYKGMIGTTPYGTGWGEVAMLFGSDSTWRVAQCMAPNVAGFGGSNNFGPIITGQFPIFAFSGSTSNALRQKEKGAPIDLAFPFQAYELNSINMLAGSPHPNASRLFAIFLRTPEGQKILWEYNRQDSPFLETSHEYKQVREARAAGEQVLLYTEADVQKHLDAFNKLVPAIDKMFQTY